LIENQIFYFTRASAAKPPMGSEVMDCSWAATVDAVFLAVSFFAVANEKDRVINATRPRRIKALVFIRIISLNGLNAFE
jgi:hypothetical protein